MNAYRRPGYPDVPASEGHLLRVVSTHGPFAARFLAAEERHSLAVMEGEQSRRLRRTGMTSGGQATASTWLRQTVGSALVRLGERLQGAPTAVAATSAAG